MTEYKVGDTVDSTWGDPEGVTHGVEATITATAPVLMASTVTMCGIGLPEGHVIIVDGDDVIDCDPCLAGKWDDSLQAVLDETIVAGALASARDLIPVLTHHRKRWLRP